MTTRMGKRPDSLRHPTQPMQPSNSASLMKRTRQWKKAKRKCQGTCMNITSQICCLFSQHNSRMSTLEDTWREVGYKTWPESSWLDCWVFSWLYYFWSFLILDWGNVLAQEVGYYSKTLNVLSCVQFLLCPLLSVFHELNIPFSVNKHCLHSQYEK